jgi:hypothetical protein
MFPSVGGSHHEKVLQLSLTHYEEPRPSPSFATLAWVRVNDWSTASPVQKIVNVNYIWIGEIRRRPSLSRTVQITAAAEAGVVTPQGRRPRDLCVPGSQGSVTR